MVRDDDDMSKGRRATPADWKTLPLPDERTAIDLDRRFSLEELDQIQRGIIPEEMEDKWFVYWEEDTLFFHRSWTGVCVYVVRFRCEEDGLTMIGAEVNRDSKQYRLEDIAHDAEMIPYLVNVLLLKRPAPFPSKSSSKTRAALEQWSQVGRAGLGEHPGGE